MIASPYDTGAEPENKSSYDVDMLQKREGKVSSWSGFPVSADTLYGALVKRAIDRLPGTYIKGQ